MAYGRLTASLFVFLVLATGIATPTFEVEFVSIVNSTMATPQELADIVTRLQQLEVHSVHDLWQLGVPTWIPQWLNSTSKGGHTRR